MWLGRRFAGEIPRRSAAALLLLPLLFTGRAMARGELYGPADFYPGYVPWRAAGPSVAGPANPILSDLAFANIPWRAAVREAVANGRFPFWNRFVLAGGPLLAAAQAGIFHPSTWAGILLPLALSWTFSCTFTLFLGLLAAYLFFRDHGLSEIAVLAGAAGWGLSTYLVFWNGWSVGPSTATFPLLLLGLRRIARRGPCGVGLTAGALVLSVTGGHPESAFHTAMAAGVYFLAELFAARARSGAMRPLGGALGAGLLAFLLAAPQLLPLLEAIPHTSEYRARRAQIAAGAASQSVGAAESARRLLPAVLPFSHGIYGKSPVQGERGDGSGMPIAYAGAILFPLAALGLARRRPGRGFFAASAAAGLLLGASAPGLIDLLTRLPGFALALNYRLVFLAAFGLAGLAAFGVEELARAGRARRLALAAAAAVLVLAALAAAARGTFADRALPPAFVLRQLAFELVPVGLLAAAALVWIRRPARLAAAALVLLVAQRGLEMHAVYPTVSPGLLRASLPEMPGPAAPGARFVAAGEDLRPNGAALLGIEDVRGYESIVLDRFADTFPLWCVPQHASFNRVDDLRRPFLEFLGARFAVTAAGAPPPVGWIPVARSACASVFENPRALPRAFAPRRVVPVADARAAVDAMAAASDFSDAAWVVAAPGAAIARNPDARVSLRLSGPDLWIETESPAPLFVATSIPDWPGWRAEEDGRALELQTVNHAFVGVRVPGGSRRIRLSYRPPSFSAGLAACAAGLLAAVVSELVRRRRGGG